jgi:hypothetical protein
MRRQEIPEAEVVMRRDSPQKGEIMPGSDTDDLFIELTNSLP